MYLSSSARFAKERGFFQFARLPAILSIFVSLMKSSHWWVEEVLNECHCVTQLQPKFSRDAENEGIAELLVGFISIHDLPSPPVESNRISPCKGGDVQTVRISFRRRSSHIWFPESVGSTNKKHLGFFYFDAIGYKENIAFKLELQTQDQEGGARYSCAVFSDEYGSLRSVTC